MSARIIDGKIVAAQLRSRVADQAAKLKAEHDITPGLAVILVGNDPASAIYVGAKNKAAQEVGFRAFDMRHPDTLSQEALLDEVRTLNADPTMLSGGLTVYDNNSRTYTATAGLNIGAGGAFLSANSANSGPACLPCLRSKEARLLRALAVSA